MDVMGDDYINKNLIFIKFVCAEVPDTTT